MNFFHRGRPPTVSSPQYSHHSLNFRQWSALLISACVLPATIAATVLILSLYYQGRESIEAATLHAARALMLAIDNELSRVEGVAFALATSPSLASGDLTSFAKQASSLPRYGPGTNLVLWDKNGHQLLNTVAHDATAARAFQLPDAVRQVFETGRPTISDLYTGPVTGRRLISVDVPVSPDGQVKYVLSSQIFGEQLQEILARQNIPQTWVVGVLDSRGIVVARTRDPRRFVGTPGTTRIRARIAQTNEGIIPDRTLEGIPAVAIFSTSPTSHWTVVIGVHRSALDASLWRAIAWLAFGVLLLFASGLGMAKLIGTRIAASVHGLVAPAIALGEGRPVTLPTFRLREADEVGQAMLIASELLLRRTMERDAAARAEYELREAKQEVERSEAFLRGVFEESPDAVLLVATDGAVVRANSEAEHVFGHLHGPLTGLTIDNVLQPLSVHERSAREILAEEVAGRQRRERFTLLGRRADGKTFPADMMVSALSGKGHRLTIVTVRDVSDRERKEAALKESEHRFRSTFEHAPIGIATVSLEGKFIDCNRAVNEILGYDQDTLRGLDATELIHAEDLTLERTQCVRLLRDDDRVNQTALRFRHSDGHAVPVLMTRALLRDDQGQASHFIVQLQDISERKRTEQELVTLNERLELATRAGGIAVWDWNLVEEELVWDDHMYALYKVALPSPRVTSVATWAACVHPEDLERVEREGRQAIEQGGGFATNFRIVWPDGEIRQIRAHALVSRSPSGVALHMTGVNMDVTDATEKEAAITTALLEKETLLKELYHRVKNNLQMIMSLFNLQARTLPPGIARTALTEGASRVQAMALVHEKLYQSGKLSSIMLDTYVKDLCAQLGVTASASTRGIEFRIEVEPIQIGLDTAVPVGLLLNELISNSLKHAFPDDRKGHILVHIGTLDGDTVELRVSDDGVGFPDDVDRTSSRTLGLKLVAALSSQLGGGSYTRENRDGACVTVTFRADGSKSPQLSQDRRKDHVGQREH
ncbi:MAG: PAS domain S-box protein [Duganella sp.]